MLDRDLIHVLLGKDSARGQQRIRMVAAWPKVGAARGEALLKRWAMLATVPVSVARLLAPALLEHGICLPGGALDPTAAAVVDTVLVEQLEPRVAPRRAAQERPT